MVTGIGLQDMGFRLVRGILKTKEFQFLVPFRVIEGSNSGFFIQYDTSSKGSVTGDPGAYSAQDEQVAAEWRNRGY